MKRVLILGGLTLLLQAEPIELGMIDVVTKAGAEVVKDVSGEDIKSADLGEALFKQSAVVTLSRRSGIANDIAVRGQRKDNINVMIDGCKVCGACPNRMDPPISHVLTNNVDFIEINEGPFSVEDFGVLSANIKVHTIKPDKEFGGDINLGYGSFGYKKGAFSLTGGVENVRFLLSGSMEQGEQYEDGNGDDFAGQIAREVDASRVPSSVQYQSDNLDMDAYSKKTLMAKLFWDISDNQELKLSYTANRSDDILYPSSKMDALYDDSDIFDIEYNIADIGRYSKNLELKLYQSEVEHPMSTEYRKMGAVDYMTHTLSTKMQGAKIANSFDIGMHTVKTGLDYSMRNWDGGYYKNDKALPEAKFHSIWDVDTQNIAFFISDSMSMGKLTLDFGLRYDTTEVTSANSKQQTNEYDELNGFVLATYTENEYVEYFAGVGKSSRVPDGKELYWYGSMGNEIGTNNLENVVNYELDIGIKKEFENATLKAKIFYSKLDNFIVYNATKTTTMMGKKVALNAYENVDATLIGFDISGTLIATGSIYFDYGIAYQKGKKDDALEGQTGTNLPDIAPLKFNGAINYDYDDELVLRAEVVGADEWSDFDKENGEQKLDAYGVVNLKATKTFGDNITLVVGVDNALDNDYAVSNTYKDLILLPTTANSEVMLLNEPRRYFYTNIRYTF